MKVTVMYRNNWFGGDRWDNPCGHIDTYKSCLMEAKYMPLGEIK